MIAPEDVVPEAAFFAFVERPYMQKPNDAAFF
jgi:hypothetical protein